MIISLLLPLACGSSSSSSSSTPQPTEGNVEIGLVDAPSAGYQNILMNLISVRLNPARNANDGTTGWVGIPVPSGVGGGVGPLVYIDLTGGGAFFNISNPNTNPGTSELQIDLNNLQDNVQLFNTARVPAQTYHTLQLKIDPNIPGNIVPNCSNVFPPGTEGCISYPIAIVSPAALATTTAIPVGKNVLTTLVVEINPGIPVAPSTNGGKYQLSPIISLIPNAGSPPGVNPKMALVQGNVRGIPSGISESVTAEDTGTGNVIASAKVSGGAYGMQLPVSSDGTSYDFFASGNGSSYDVTSDVALTRGQALLSNNFTVGSATTGVLSGAISDACSTGVPVEGATVQILTGPDCSTLPTPAGCVVLASTTTNVTGSYPSPGRSGMPQPFNFLPAAPDGTYAIKISASGYDTLAAPISDTTGPVTCPTSPSGKQCSFPLTRAVITGTVSITPAAGTTAQVQVFAEITGTNDLVGALPAPLSIPACGSPPCSASFSLNVPTMPGTYDIFATSIDLYNGAPDPFPGQVFATLAGISSPTECASVAAPANLALSCAGHGSISGTVGTYDTNTTVRLMEDGVQVAQTNVGPAGTSNAGAYSFCAPADSYSVQRWENDLPAGTAVDVIVPTPVPTSTPCALCRNADGSCPGNCLDTTGPTL
ncbi:MAG TPA: DUF4382 domain-containing protein [Candidatus Binataceae bacterium]|nr:DUF4382 domain-containing protein [Candidatus Binataceae bacterium]